MGTYQGTAKNIAIICGNRGWSCLMEGKEAVKEIYTEIRLAPAPTSTPSDN